ncbi:hypothetical protein FQN55_000429 [Onygenales sp. PD_40]|nr:hypothetical protein FQN55_000429 [Onygenales sp. PD_40]
MSNIGKGPPTTMPPLNLLPLLARSGSPLPASSRAAAAPKRRQHSQGGGTSKKKKQQQEEEEFEIEEEVEKEWPTPSTPSDSSDVSSASSLLSPEPEPEDRYGGVRHARDSLELPEEEVSPESEGNGRVDQPKPADTPMPDPPPKPLAIVYAGRASCLRCAKLYRNGQGVICVREPEQNKCNYCRKKKAPCLPVPAPFLGQLRAMQELADQAEAGLATPGDIRALAAKFTPSVENYCKLQKTSQKKKDVTGPSQDKEVVALLRQISEQLPVFTEVLPVLRRISEQLAVITEQLPVFQQISEQPPVTEQLPVTEQRPVITDQLRDAVRDLLGAAQSGTAGQGKR